MLRAIVGQRVRCCLASIIQWRRAYSASGKAKEETPVKIAINSADYRLKKVAIPKAEASRTPEKAKEKGSSTTTGKPSEPIGWYRADKKVEYEWIAPDPNDSGFT